MNNTLTITHELQPSKQAAATMAQQIVSVVTSGNVNPLEAAAKMKVYVDAFDEAQKEIRKLALDELALHGKSVEMQGVKFEQAEVGTSYDFSLCGDAELIELEAKLKKRKDFLKTIPMSGLETINETTGEVIRLYPPAKKSTTSIKISLPK